MALLFICVLCWSSFVLSGGGGSGGVRAPTCSVLCIYIYIYIYMCSMF